MIQNTLYKKFSIGISFSQINDKELISIISDFKDTIHDIYFSPVEDISFQSRYGIYDFNNTTYGQRLEALTNVINVAKGIGIKTTITLNTRKNVNEAFLIYKNYKTLFNIDQVTTTSDLATIIHHYDMNEKLICSYNEGIYNKEKLKKVIDLNCFSSIVLGNHFMRDFKAFEYLNKKNIETILLINNGCLSNCKNFCRQHGVCENNFTESKKHCSPMELYSKESLFPEELHKYYLNRTTVKIFKLSTRPINYSEYKDLMLSYISGNSEKYIKNSKYNYHLYGRLAYFKSFYSDFNYQDISSQKDRIWNSIT